MKKSNLIILAVSAIIVLLLVFGIIKLRAYMPKYNWYESYSSKSKEPYGTKVLRDLIEASAKKDGFHLINKPLSAYYHENVQNATYIFIGASFIIDTLELSCLFDFVQHGNKAFISSNEIPYSMMTSLIPDSAFWYPYATFEDSTVAIDMEKEMYGFEYQFAKDVAEYNWVYIDSSFFYSSMFGLNTDPISNYNNGKINFCSIPYGDGEFFFHTTPLTFTNYHAIKEENLDYLDKVFSMLENDNIYWDEFHKAPSLYTGGSQNFSETPLKFILSQKELRWAWYLGLVMVLVFVVFKSKREQKPIPNLQDKSNNSIDYVKAIATLYYQSGSHRKIAEEMKKMYFAFLRNRYNIPTSIEKDLLLELISAKSGIGIGHIKRIYKLNIKVTYSNYTADNELIEYFKSLKYFYKNCN